MTTFNNDTLKNELASEFIRRNDMVNRWGSVISSYLALPGLRFFAPMSAVGASGQAIDLALQNHLSATSSPVFNVSDLIPYCLYNGTSNYHSIADDSAHDIIGNEGYIANVVKGLTMGMWVSPASAESSATRLFSKGTSTGNARAYSLGQALVTADRFFFTVSDNGTNNFSVEDSANFSTNVWYFVVGRYDPSAEVKIWVGGSGVWRTTANVTSIPATLNNSATGLAIGAQADGTQFSNVTASMCFLCCQALSDVHIFSLFEQSRTIFGI